jgi:ABC-type transport system substrate-binding protein
LSRKFLKYGWLALGLLLIGALVAFPACTEPGPGPLPSEYIGSGLLDGHGIPVDFFSDIHVRKGMCYAFDYDTYVADGLSGQGIVRGSPVVEGLPYFNPDSPQYSYNLTLAEQEFKAATIGDVWNTGFVFTMLYNSGNLPRKTACDILQQDLVTLNPKFNVAVQPLAWSTILGKIFGTRDMPMFQIGWLPDYPHPDNFIVPFMSSSGTFSMFQGYGNAVLDAQIAAAFQDTNPVTQQAKYYALQAKYYEDAPGIVLAQPIARRYFTKHIDGFYYNPVESAYPGRLYDMTKTDNGGDIPFLNPTDFVQETIGGGIDSMDPAWCYDTASGEEIGRVYETLIYYDGVSTEDFIPLLATDTGTWSDNDTTVTFTIKTDVQFSNGENLTAEDVEYSFERAMTQDRPGGPIWMLYQSLIGPDAWSFEDATWANIDAAVTRSGDDVSFHLAGAYWKLPFLQVLCGAWSSIVDKSWCIAQGDWDGTEGDITNFLHPEDAGDTALYDTAMGTGPWTLTTWDQGVQIIETKNNNYWNAGVQAVPFDHVITKFIDEWTTRKLDLLAGTADLVYVPATNFADMDAEEPNLHVYKDLPSLSIDCLFMNMIIGGPEE